MTQDVADDTIPEPAHRRRPLYHHPEFGAFVAAVTMLAFFGFVARDAGFLAAPGFAGWLTTAAELGIVAVPVAMLMIAGHFDLSIGSVLGMASIIVALGTGYFKLPFPVAAALAFLAAAAVGLANGALVNRTRLPSFIVTLATNFIVFGVSLGLSRQLAGTSTISITVEDVWHTVFAAKIGDFNIAIAWWAGMALLAGIVLARTPFGSWVYASGGSAESARRAGVPTERVTRLLFAWTALGAALAGIIQAIEFNSGNAATGQGFVFQAPIVAVIGGVLLTGGYGSITGVVLGTMTYAIVSIGMFYTGWNTDWASAVIGALLVIAVLGNDVIRRLALTTPSTDKREASK